MIFYTLGQIFLHCDACRGLARVGWASAGGRFVEMKGPGQLCVALRVRGLTGVLSRLTVQPNDALDAMTTTSIVPDGGLQVRPLGARSSRKRRERRERAVIVAGRRPFDVGAYLMPAPI